MEKAGEGRKKKPGMGECLAPTTSQKSPACLDDEKKNNKKQCASDDDEGMSTPVTAPTIVTPARRTRSKSITTIKGSGDESSIKETNAREKSERGADEKTVFNESVGMSPSPVGSMMMTHSRPEGAGSPAEGIARVNAKNAPPDVTGSIDAIGSAPPSPAPCQAPPSPSTPRQPQPSIERKATNALSEYDKDEQQRKQPRKSLDGMSFECDDNLQDGETGVFKTSTTTPPATQIGSLGFFNFGTTTSSGGNHRSDVQEHRFKDSSDIESVGLRVEGLRRIHETPPAQVSPFKGTSGPPINVAELMSAQDLYVHGGASKSLRASCPQHDIKSLRASCPQHDIDGSLTLGTAMHVEQSSELQLIRRGASRRFDSNKPLQEPQGYQRTSMPSAPCAPGSSLAPGFSSNRDQGRLTSFDANSDHALEAQLVQMAAELRSHRDHQSNQPQPQSQQDFLDSFLTPHETMGTATPSLGSNSWGGGQGFRVPESRRTAVHFDGDGGGDGGGGGTAARGQQRHQHGAQHPHHQHQQQQQQQQRQYTREEVNAMMVNTVLRVSPGGVRNPRSTNNNANNVRCDGNTNHDQRNIGGTRSEGEVDHAVARPLQVPVRRRRSLEDDGSSSLDANEQSCARSAKKRRPPYRCKQCGQLKNSHRCPYKNINSQVDIRTLGSQTDDLAPGTVFEPADLPVPSLSGDNVFYCRPYHPELTNHDPATRPFQHPPTEGAAEGSVNGAGAAGRSADSRPFQPESYTPSLMSSSGSRFESFHQRLPSFGTPFCASRSEVPAVPEMMGAPVEGVGGKIAATRYAVGVPPPTGQGNHYSSAGLGNSGRGVGGGSTWSGGPPPLSGEHGHGNDALDNSFHRYGSEGVGPASIPMSLGPISEIAHKRRSSSGISTEINNYFRRSSSSSSGIQLTPEMQALEDMFFARWSENAAAGLLPRSEYTNPYTQQFSTERRKGLGERGGGSEPPLDSAASNNSKDNDDDDTRTNGDEALDTVMDTCSFSPWQANNSAAGETAGRASKQAGGSGSVQGGGQGAGGGPCVGGAAPTPLDAPADRTDRNEFSV